MSEARLEAILRATPSLMTVMETVRRLDLPDWLIFSGAIYQPVWNHLTGREPDYGIKDYDLGYFEPDTSWDAEDVVIRRVAAAFPSPLREMVEPRNQARVHLWFEDKYAEAYTPLTHSAEALERFTATVFAVGARLEADGSMSLFAPFGLEDLFAMRLRPNPVRQTSGFEKTAANAMRRWPEAKIVESA